MDGISKYIFPRSRSAPNRKRNICNRANNLNRYPNRIQRQIPKSFGFLLPKEYIYPSLLDAYHS